MQLWTAEEARMTAAKAVEGGLDVTFADGCRGILPWSEALGNESRDNVKSVRAGPSVVTVRLKHGEPIELPWDFVRAGIDPNYWERETAIIRETQPKFIARAQRD